MHSKTTFSISSPGHVEIYNCLMGTKKVIFDTKEMSWGLEDTNYYWTFDEFKNNFAKSILKKLVIFLRVCANQANHTHTFTTNKSKL